MQACHHRGLPHVDWEAVTAAALEPALRKPLRLRFRLTCLDLSLNLNAALTVCSSSLGHSAHCSVATLCRVLSVGLQAAAECGAASPDAVPCCLPHTTQTLSHSLRNRAVLIQTSRILDARLFTR